MGGEENQEGIEDPKESHLSAPRAEQLPQPQESPCWTRQVEQLAWRRTSFWQTPTEETQRVGDRHFLSFLSHDSPAGVTMDKTDCKKERGQQGLGNVGQKSPHPGQRTGDGQSGRGWVEGNGQSLRSCPWGPLCLVCTHIPALPLDARFGLTSVPRLLSGHFRPVRAAPLSSALCLCVQLRSLRHRSVSWAFLYGSLNE